jgi:hypothetical protein
VRFVQLWLHRLLNCRKRAVVLILVRNRHQWFHYYFSSGFLLALQATAHHVVMNLDVEKVVAVHEVINFNLEQLLKRRVSRLCSFNWQVSHWLRVEVGRLETN